MQQSTHGELTGLNIVVASSILLAAALGWWYVIPNYVPVDPNQLYGLSPAFMPKVACAVSGLLGLVLLVKSLLVVAGKLPVLDEESEDGDALRMQLPEIGFCIGFACAAGVFVASLQWLGFIATSALALSIVMLLFQVRPRWLIALLAILVPSAIYYGLWHGLTVQLPSFW